MQLVASELTSYPFMIQFFRETRQKLLEENPVTHLLAVIQRLIGWFKLKIFSVSLISQLLN